MIIMSIDASTKSTGVAVFNDDKLISYKLITATQTDLIKRIKTIIKGLEEYIQEQSTIDKIVIEEVRPEAGPANLKTWRALMFLQAAINFMIYDNKLKAELIYMYPSEWRKHCKIKQGRGIKREQLKAEDIAWVKEKFNIDNINDDIADAIGIGYGYLQSLNDAFEHEGWG